MKQDIVEIAELPKVKLNDWIELSPEVWREYVFPGGHAIKVFSPAKLHITRKPNGDSHRIIDKDGYGIYIPDGWLMIRWKPEPGTPAFTF